MRIVNNTPIPEVHRVEKYAGDNYRMELWDFSNNTRKQIGDSKHKKYFKSLVLVPGIKLDSVQLHNIYRFFDIGLRVWNPKYDSYYTALEKSKKELMKSFLLNADEENIKKCINCGESGLKFYDYYSAKLKNGII